jgi:hypothetical protein
MRCVACNCTDGITRPTLILALSETLPSRAPRNAQRLAAGFFGGIGKRQIQDPIYLPRQFFLGPRAAIATISAGPQLFMCPPPLLGRNQSLQVHESPVVQMLEICLSRVLESCNVSALGRIVRRASLFLAASYILHSRSLNYQASQRSLLSLLAALLTQRGWSQALP